MNLTFVLHNCHNTREPLFQIGDLLLNVSVFLAGFSQIRHNITVNLREGILQAGGQGKSSSEDTSVLPSELLKHIYCQLDYKAIGKRIKIARIKADLTQERLAEMVEISPTHMSNIETGTTRVSLTAIVSLANALSVTVDDLLCDSVVKSKVQFEKDIAGILADCDEYEIRMVKDMAQVLKETLRRDAHLRKQ